MDPLLMQPFTFLQKNERSMRHYAEISEREARDSLSDVKVLRQQKTIAPPVCPPVEQRTFELTQSFNRLGSGRATEIRMFLTVRELYQGRNTIRRQTIDWWSADGYETKDGKVVFPDADAVWEVHDQALRLMHFLKHTHLCAGKVFRGRELAPCMHKSIDGPEIFCATCKIERADHLPSKKIIVIDEGAPFQRG